MLTGPHSAFPPSSVCELNSPTDALAKERFLSSSFSSEGSVPQSPLPSRAYSPRCCDVQLADGSALAKHKQQCHPELDDRETLASPVGPLPPLEFINWGALAVSQAVVPLDAAEIGKKNLSADIAYALAQQNVLARNLVLPGAHHLTRPNDLRRSTLPVDLDQNASMLSCIPMSDEFSSEVGSTTDPQRRRSAPSIMSSPNSTHPDASVTATSPAVIDSAIPNDAGVIPANGDVDVNTTVSMYENIPEYAYLEGGIFGAVSESYIFSGEVPPASVALSDVHHVRPGARSVSKRPVSASGSSGHAGAHRRSATAPIIHTSTVPILSGNAQGVSNVQQQAGRGTKRSQSSHEGAKNSAPKRRAVQAPISASTFQAILPGIAPVGSAAPIAGAAQVVAVPTVASEPVDKPFKCDVPGCTKTYKNASGLKYHLAHGHTDPNGDDGADRPYRCGINACPKTYKNANGLKYHLDHHHPGYTVAQVVSAGANGQMNASQQGSIGLQSSSMGQTNSNSSIASRRRSTGTKNPRPTSRRRSTTSGASNNQSRQRTQGMIVGSNDSYQSLAPANVAGATPITVPNTADASNGTFVQLLQFLQDDLQLYNLIHYGSGSQQPEAGAQVTVIETIQPTHDGRHASCDMNNISTDATAATTTITAATAAIRTSSPCRAEPQ